MPSSRVADSTIKGFIYQFNKTILEILDSSTGTIHVEGIVEDVDVYDANNSIRAIQCKYHESAKSFTLSLIYKPIILISVHDKFHRTLILSGFCLLKIAKISLNSSFFPKPIKR